MRARGAIEDAVVTPEFEHVLATMEAMHEEELRRVRDKYEAEMATFKRFANDREGETAQAVLDAMQHILEESNRRIDELEAELARAASSAVEREEEFLTNSLMKKLDQVNSEKREMLMMLSTGSRDPLSGGGGRL